MSGILGRLRHFGIVFRMAAESWSSDRAPSMGAALAYYTVFSLTPMLVLVVAVAGLAFGRQAAEGALFGELAGVIGADSAKVVEDTLASASSTKSGIIASVAGFFTLIFAATAVFGELQSSLNVIWKAEAPARSGVWNYARSRLLSLSLVLTIGFLLLVSLALSAALTAFADLLDRTLPGLPLILRIVHLALSLGFLTLFFAMMFKILPDTDVEWRDVWSGAAATALLFTLGKYLIGLYIGSSAVASAYGAASALVILLIWVYYSAQILLFGAEFAKARCDHRLSLQAPKPG